MNIANTAPASGLQPSAAVVEALNTLASRVPQMLASSDDDCDFWCEFSGEADAILESASGDDYEFANGRIGAILKAYGIDDGYGSELSDF